jgi:antitoxin CptB
MSEDESLARLRKRLIFGCRNRGKLETSLLLRRFSDRGLEGLSRRELAALQRIVDADDDDLWDWVSGRVTPPPDIDRGLIARIRSFKESP